jgi:hypothetical protein
VKVVNTTSAPALNSSVDDHGRVPYWSELLAGSCVAGVACTYTFGPVPIGHRLVIEHVSGSVAFSGGASEINVQLNPTTPIGSLDRYASFDVPTTGQFDMPTLVYLDPLQTVDVFVLLRGGASFSGTTRIMVTGYMLDCTAAPCAAIAH